MIISVGNDLIENIRIGETYKKFGNKFLEKVFTPDEIEYSLSQVNPIPFLSVRFACKEAFIKAIDLPSGTILNWKEVELAGKEFGKKILRLSGKAEELFKSKGYINFTVSVTHTDHYSEAVVILYGD